MLVEMRPIDSIRPYPENPRRNDQAVDAAARSIAACPVEPEVWRAVPGYEGLYEVSSLGRVRRASKSRMAPAGYILKGRLNIDGYREYGLSKSSRMWHARAHRLVALAFIGPPPFAKAHVAHADGNKLNNARTNLRWATAVENEADKRRHGRHIGALPGERHHNARLTASIVARMRKAAWAGVGVVAIAHSFAVPVPTASNAIHGVTWASVAEPLPLPIKRRTRCLTST